MTHYNLAIVGYGNVGKQLVTILQDKATILREQHGITYTITGVATRRLGWLSQAHGFETDALLNNDFLQTTPHENIHTWLQASQAHVLFELTSLNPETGQPAIDHVKAGLQAQAHVITANKGTLVHAYHALRDLAHSVKRHFLYESTVADGLPVFSLFRDTLPTTQLRQFSGLLNGTTSVILNEMEHGKTLEQAIQKAQDLGIAETDPSADIDGWDATVKVIALATVLMNEPLTLHDVQRTGIRHLTAHDVQTALQNGQRYKLVSRVTRENGALRASVQPELVPLNSVFGAVGAEALVLQFQTDTIPNMAILEDLAGPYTTAYGCLADFIYAHENPIA
jgi:homoserine dehydrogenase